MSEESPDEADDAGASTHPALAGAAPEPERLELALALSRTRSVLFGRSEAVKVGRYTLIERAGAGGMGVVWSAWDPELGRAVALKLASSRDDTARARARDEGRALAQLSHPNVVPIYDVLETEDGVFLVMELVTGKSLREVVAEGATPRELVRAYRQAGEGLAAAHRAGLVHRDFKPDNAILGADARVRVLDFGIAHELSAETREIAGTPRYMAPEQRTGGPLTAAVDQYALCASLREGLGERVPSWLAPILARGLSERPEDRFPSMTELVRALALDPAARWRRRAWAAAALLGVGATITAFAVGRTRREEEPCGGGPAQLAASWGEEQRAAVVAHLTGLATPYAAEATQRVIAGLDNYANGWIDRYGATCRAHRRSELSLAGFERRNTCLAHRRTALATLAELAGAEAGATLDNLVIAVGNLPDLAVCDDDEVLAIDAAPLVPVNAVEAGAIDALIAKADVERDTGLIDRATRDAGEALTRAEVLGYRPLIARARMARGRVALTRLQGDRGSADFREAARAAFAVGDLPLAIEAYARAAYASATSTGDLHATEGVDLIEAIAQRTDPRFRFPRALLELNLGNVAMARGERVPAQQRFERARQAARAIAGAGAGELTSAISGLMLVVDDPVASRKLGEELVAARTRLFGEHHPETLGARLLAAIADPDLAAAAPRLAAVCGDLSRYHPSLAGIRAECGYELMWMRLATGDRELAREAGELVLASQDPEAEQLRIVRALVLASSGDREAARRGLEPGLPIDDTTPWWDKMYALDAQAIGALVIEGAPRAAVRAGYVAIGAQLPRGVLARRLAALDYGLDGTADVK